MSNLTIEETKLLGELELNAVQATWLGELVENHLDDTSDWGLPQEELQEAIQAWIDVLRAIKQYDTADKIIDSYKGIVELT